MKFKDAYRRKTDGVHVRESLLDDIRAAEVEKIRAEKQKKDRPRPWMIAVPAFAAAAAVFVAVFAFVGIGKAGRGAETKTASAAYMQPSAPEAVGSYEKLAEIIQARSTGGRTSFDEGKGIFAEDAAAPGAAEMPVPAPDAEMTQSYTATVNGEGRKNYSGTNNQVEGIDEADIVKTDGEWIYALNQSRNTIYILSAKGKDTAIVSEITLPMPKENDSFWRSYEEMMLCGDKLYVLGSYNDWSKDDGDQYAFAEVYDLGDRTAPKHAGTLKQEGNYRTARLVDNVLVIVSDYHMWYIYRFDVNDVKSYVPTVDVNGTETPIAPGDIYVNPESKENGFTVVTTINAAEGREFDSYKAVLGGCGTVYFNGTDLLIASTEWQSEQSEEQTNEEGKHFVKVTSGERTNLFRFTVTDGKIEAAASTKLDGSLLNQFSMDAYNGYYRLVVTRSDSEEIIWTDGIDTYEWNNSNDCSLYVLDADLNVVGKLENLAKDERVQSVRFMGDAAYFVTFRQVDPLFSVDLSDPQNPKVLSKLKIPGFSAYLHPFGEGKLLGIGYDADEEHGWTENVKLSMFDISDPSDVKEAFKLSVKDVNYTSVQYNHKVVFADVQTGTIAFPADNVYLVFRVEGDSFKQIGTIDTGSEYWFGDARGLYVDDAFYVIGSDEVIVLSFETMEKLATIGL
ncbi:MAG: beta-propeller domain-containing protein [Clostridia bacterium]|nr:beta-propeller domain-containing protein [Clostridia bacterium]